MELWTIQLGQWRLAKERGITLIDTTLKSGVIYNNVRWLAPTPELLGNYKSGIITDLQYYEIYLNLMRTRWSQDPQWFIDFCRNHDCLALACYCSPGSFCHRLILVDILRNICTKYQIPFTYSGELKRAA